MFLKRAKVHSDKGEIDQAIENYTKALKIEKNYDSFLSRGLLYKIQGNYTLSINDYSDAIKVDSNNDSGYINRGNVYGRLNRFKEAIDDYSHAINRKETDTAYYNRGNVHERVNELEKASIDYTKAIQLNNQHYKAYFNRGIVNEKLAKFFNAIHDFTCAININQTYTSFESRGVNYYKIKKYQLAIEDFSKALKLKKSYKSFFNRAMSYLKLKQFENAKFDFTNSILLNKNNHRAYLNRALALEKLKQYDLSVKDILIAIELNPKYTSTFSKDSYKDNVIIQRILNGCKMLLKENKVLGNEILLKRINDDRFLDNFHRKGQERIQTMTVEKVKIAFLMILNFKKEVKSKFQCYDYEEMLERIRKGSIERRFSLKMYLKGVNDRELLILSHCIEIIVDIKGSKKKRLVKDAVYLKHFNVQKKLRKMSYHIIIDGIKFKKEVIEAVRQTFQYRSNINFRMLLKERRKENIEHDQRIVTKEEVYGLIKLKKWQHIKKWVDYHQFEQLDAKFTDGNTLLHYSSQYGVEKLLFSVLQRGASTVIKNRLKKTPIEVCCIYGGIKKRCLEIFDFFKKHKDVIYEGKFKDGRFHGTGKLYRKRKSGIFGVGKGKNLALEYDGCFIDGEKNGRGKEYHRNSCIKYYGLFKNGLKHGQGVEYFNDGKTVKHRGIWKENIFQKDETTTTIMEVDLTPLIKVLDYTEDYLGGGSFAEVFRLRFKGELCVAKILNRNMTDEESLEKEVRILAKLIDHPNIIKFIAWSPFKYKIVGYVTEICEKGSVAKMIQAGNIPWRMKIKILKGVVNGMSYLHENNIIHYDLKWSNVLLNKYDTVKIIDFGLSKSLESYRESLRHSRVRGTGFYIAPEIMLNGPSNNKKCDVFSFGIMLFELLVETLNPFNIENFEMGLVHSVEQKIVEDPTYRPKLGTFKFQIKEYHCHWITLMKNSWLFSPTDRPSFEQIKVYIDLFYDSIDCKIQ